MAAGEAGTLTYLWALMEGHLILTSPQEALTVAPLFI
jgi:hypothetical protein